MSKQKVFMACSNYWRSPLQVGSHHIAKAFLKAGCEVAYLSDPVSPLHLAKGLSRELQERFALHAHDGELLYGGALWTYVPFSLLTPYRAPLLSSAAVMRGWKRLAVPALMPVVERRGFSTVDLLYIDSVYQRFWLDDLKCRTSIFRIPDRNSGFPRATGAYLDAEREIARRVDLVVYSAKNLEADVAALKPRAMRYLPNGVDFDFFRSAASAPMPEEYRNLPRPIALYVGAMEEWFDFELMNRTAAALADVHFVFIGPDHLARKRLTTRPNVHLLGSRPHAELPRYLHFAQAGLIPFDVERHGALVNGINPLKLYEYMACGLPVVATAWEELRSLESPAVLCGGEAEFIGAVRDAVSKSADPRTAQEFAASKSWGAQLAPLLELL